MSDRTTLFHGLAAFPMTPATADGQVRTDLLGTFLERIHAAGADSIGLLGSTGTYAYLSRAERRRAVQTAQECIGGKTPLIVGIGALRTDEAQALARDASELGADGLLMAPMSYTPLTEEEVFQHFLSVAQATDLPLCIYNNPGTTHFTFSEALLARLSQVNTITAVKMPLPASGDIAGELSRLRAAMPADLALGYSGDWGAADALLAGADAWYSVVAGLLPGPALRLVRAAQAGDSARTRHIDETFQPLWALFKQFGSIRVMHAMAGILGLGGLQPPRPILPVPSTEFGRIEDALQRIGS